MIYNDKIIIANKLHQDVSFILGVDVKNHCRTITCNCIYSPDLRLPYKIIFYKCRKFNFIFFDEEEIDAVDDNLGDILDITIGVEEYLQDAFIHTDYYDLIISYSSFEIEKSWTGSDKAEPFRKP